MTSSADAPANERPDREPAAIERLELRRIRLPLRAPFRSSQSREHVRDILLVRVTTREAEGWGECVAPVEPHYSAEYVDGAADVIRRFLGPALLAAGPVRAQEVAGVLARVAGHPMAKAALEVAVLDAELRAEGRSLAQRLGAARHEVDAGVAAGVADDLDALVEEVADYVSRGYRRVKLKIEPGWDEGPVGAVRAAFPDLALQVDANGAYAGHDHRALSRLDAYALLLIEQPLAADDLLGHAALARRLGTPLCLDESIGGATAAAVALALGACSVLNVKAGRVGGVFEAVRIHDLGRRRGIPMWVGGMLETGLGRAVNVALAALPGFNLTGDISASDRYWQEDLTEPFQLRDGHLTVPSGPGLGVAPLPDVLADTTTAVEELTATHRSR